MFPNQWIDVLDVSGLSWTEKICAACAQGIINRNGAHLFLDYGIYDDPDAPAGTWVHWILYNLPPTTDSLAENVRTLPKGTKVGMNSWSKVKYDSPCPPPGNYHHYIFHCTDWI